MRTKSRFLMFIINKNKLKIEYLMIYNFLFPTKPNTTKTSLLLLVVRIAIFGEFVCSMAFIIGFLYRLAMIPMIFTMIVAFFIVHANDAFAVKELAFIYLIVFIIMYIAGPGKFSIDHIIGNEMARRKLKS